MQASNISPALFRYPKPLLTRTIGHSLIECVGLHHIRTDHLLGGAVRDKCIDNFENIGSAGHQWI